MPILLSLLNTVVEASESKKAAIKDLICAFVQADIPLEKVDKLKSWLRMYLREGGNIPSGNALRRDYLPGVFENYLITIKQMFSGKKVSLIVDETTDSRARSVVNVLFNYRDLTKLVVVDYLDIVNNSTIGQLIVRILVDWNISFHDTRLIVSDSAAYMKKCVREVLRPIMPQIMHQTYLINYKVFFFKFT